jgi:uncharacterized NAD(P)/FAD-binding protein YdhS
MNIRSEANFEKNIVIVGAGFSGTMAAVQLLRKSKRLRLNIYLIDASGMIGRGLAYQTADDNFLLNVPSGNMSAFPDRPSDFTEYCQTIDPAFMSGSFITRRIYGDYLEHTLLVAERESSSKLARLCVEVVSIQNNKEETGWNVSLSDGQLLRADQVVLALGHFASQPVHPFEVFLSEAQYINNPWNMKQPFVNNGTLPVVLLGTGHTAIDTLFRLTSGDFSKKVVLISRRGLLPNEHRFSSKPPLISAEFPKYLECCSPNIRAYVKAIRKEIATRAELGVDWRDVLNEMRPHTPELWCRLSVADRKKFLYRVAPYWDVYRHRMAPAAHVRLKKLIESGQVEVIAGRIKTVSTDQDNICLEIKIRGSERIDEIHAVTVVNCTGPNYDLSKVDMLLIKQLLKEDLISQDPLKIGLEINSDYQVLRNDHSPIEGLFYVGPMLKAKYWEAIAVPELRGHVARLVEKLVIS